MKTLIYPTYFPSISHFVAIAKADDIWFETEDNFQKQTNRNRMFIYSPRGKFMLNIPVKKGNSRQKTKDIKIENAFEWQKNHFKTLETSYRSSPFFEYFEDYLNPIFTKQYTFLMDLNFDTIQFAAKCLQLKLHFEKTTEYFHEVPNCIDLRYLADGKKDKNTITPYNQVFQEKEGFINNLSILDLLFNEGKFALDYLKKQRLY